MRLSVPELRSLTIDTPKAAAQPIRPQSMPEGPARLAGIGDQFRQRLEPLLHQDPLQVGPRRRLRRIYPQLERQPALAAEFQLAKALLQQHVGGKIPAAGGHGDFLAPRRPNITIEVD